MLRVASPYRFLRNVKERADKPGRHALGRFVAAFTSFAKGSFLAHRPVSLRGDAHLGVLGGDGVCGDSVERHERLSWQRQSGGGEICPQMRDRRSSGDQQDVWSAAQQPGKRHLHGRQFEALRDVGQG
jgi:hypothetical protein